MGVIGDKLKEKGWTKSKLELLNLAVTLLFFAALLWFAYSSSVLEGKCRATLFTGEKVSYDPMNPPNFSEQVVKVNLSAGNCSRVTICTKVWSCKFPPIPEPEDIWGITGT